MSITNTARSCVNYPSSKESTISTKTGSKLILTSKNRKMEPDTGQLSTQELVAAIADFRLQEEIVELENQILAKYFTKLTTLECTPKNIQQMIPQTKYLVNMNLKLSCKTKLEWISQKHIEEKLAYQESLVFYNHKIQYINVRIAWQDKTLHKTLKKHEEKFCRQVCWAATIEEVRRRKPAPEKVIEVWENTIKNLRTVILTLMLRRESTRLALEKEEHKLRNAEDMSMIMSETDVIKLQCTNEWKKQELDTVSNTHRNLKLISARMRHDYQTYKIEVGAKEQQIFKSSQDRKFINEMNDRVREEMKRINREMKRRKEENDLRQKLFSRIVAPDICEYRACVAEHKKINKLCNSQLHAISSLKRRLNIKRKHL